MKNVFDMDNVDDLPEECRPTVKRDNDVFGQEVLEVFKHARDYAGLSNLHVDQVMVAFNRMHKDKYEGNPKNKVQLMNKLLTMSQRGKYPQFERVSNGTYRLN